MELKKHHDQRLPERKGQKRKLEEEIEEGKREISAAEAAAAAPYGEARRVILNEVYTQVNILNSTFSWHETHRGAAKRATHILAELAKNGNLNFLKFPGLTFVHEIEIRFHISVFSHVLLIKRGILLQRKW
jgi:hypothetical protein